MDTKDDIRDSKTKTSAAENMPVSTIKHDVLLSPIVHNPYLPLSDINNTREHISSLEEAQKKWIENSKSWPVKDELQNAQLQWLKEFSSESNFLCTSTPQTKKNIRHTLPWSPPKNSTDVGSRRNAVVYRPGSTYDIKAENGRFLNEKGNCVKVARLKEPSNVSPLKRAQEDKPKQKLFSPFPAAESREAKKSPGRQRYITVRRKLERLKNLATEGEKDGEQKFPTQDNKSAEKREIARQYILRKRAERERELEIQRRKEAKVEADKKARLERLRETQQRLIKHSAKRQTPEKKPVSRELEESDEGCVPLWKVSPQICETVEARESSEISRPSPSISSAAVCGDEPEIIKNDGETKALDDPHIAELFLDRNISSAKKMALLDRLEEGALTGKDSLSDILVSQEYLAAVRSSPKKHSKSPINDTSCPSSSSSIKLSTFDNNSSKRNTTAPENSMTSLTSSSKESMNILNLIRQNEILAPGNIPLDNCGSYLDVHPTSQGMEPSYNILRAVSNKRAAYEHFNKECSADRNSEVFGKPLTSRSLFIDDFGLLKSQGQRNFSSDKGIQCYVGESSKAPSNISSNDQLSSSNIYYNQNECLTKPDFVLFPGRTSDSCLYKHSKSFFSDKPPDPALMKKRDETLIDNLADTDVNHLKNLNHCEDILAYSQSQKDIVSPNVPERPHTVVMLSHDPLSVPEDINLRTLAKPNLSRKSIEEAKAAKQNPIFSLFNYRSVSNYGLNTTSFSTKSEDNNYICTGTSTVEVAAAPLSLDEVNRTSDRDRRIQEEIKKLDKFNESIASVMEKNKSFISEADLYTKDPDETGILELSVTSSTVNNDLDPLQGNVGIQQSHSLSSTDAPSEEVSGSSILKFSLNMFNELLKDEDSRSSHQSSLFKMKEKALTEKIKAEIAFLEVEKKKMKESGNEDGVRNCRKKIRGLIIKLEHDLEELHRLRKNEKFEYKKRRQKLIEKINMIKMQLKMQQPENLKGIRTKEGCKKVLNSSQEMKKMHVSDRRGSDIPQRAALLDKKRKELEHRETVIAERLAELENISTWKQRLEEGEKRIMELEARLKMTSPSCKGPSNDPSNLAPIDRGTSPFRITSDESHCEAQKAEGSYSDTFDQGSTSSTHEKLEEKDARKMMAIKVPLSPLVTLKRRHSSGSDESLLQSQTETQSEASDMEIRVLALQQQLKQRKAKLESLHREYKKSQKERLIAKEQSLLSQIQAYDMYIEQVKKEIEKEKDSSNIKVVKPLIKQPKIFSDRRKSDTWLIQDRKNRDDSTKDLLKNSSFLCSSTELIPKIHSDSDNDKALVKRESLKLDSSNLEKFSLKTKLMLKTSHSDPNLLNSSDDRTVESKIYHSSTESCESDLDKIKLLQNESNEIEENLQLPLTYIESEADFLNSLYPSVVVKTSESKNDTAHGTAIGLIREKDVINEDKFQEESEENTQSTQASIVPKVIVENKFAHNDDGSSDKTVSESIDEKSLTVEEIDGLLNQNDTINSEAEVIYSYSENKKIYENEKLFSSFQGSDNIPSVQETNVDGTVKFESEEKVSEAKIVDVSDSQTEIVSEIVSHSEKIMESEVISEKISETDLLSNDVSKESGIPSGILVVSEKSDDSACGSITPEMVCSKTFVDPENVGTSVSTSNVISVKDTSLNISEEIRSLAAPNYSSGDSNSVQESITLHASDHKSVLEEKEDSEQKLEESLKEVTYLEVSDHIYPETAIEEDPSHSYASEECSRVLSELSGTDPVKSNSLINELDALDEGSISNQKVECALSTANDDDKSTFHSASDDIVSRVISDKSEDMSDGSFPLPISKFDKSKLFEDQESIVQVISEIYAEVPTEGGDINKSIAESLQSNGSNPPQSLVSQEVLSNIEEISSVDMTDIAENNSELSAPNSTVNLQSVVSTVSSVNLENQSSVEVENKVENELVTMKDEIESENLESSHSHESGHITENVEDKSFSESEVLHDSDVKSPLEEQVFEDSLDENSVPLTSIKLKSKLYGGQEEYEDYDSVSDASDSYIEDKYSEEDVYTMTGQLPDEQSTISKHSCAPLIDSLQREGESALDVVWRSIAESAVEEGKELVISTFLKRLKLYSVPETTILLENQIQRKPVGDNDEEDWNKEKLPRDQAEEAEVLRLQQIRIDKEIEELEEEEARQYYYVRPIPDKPPPPYTPRRSSLVASVVEAAGELWAGRAEPPTSFMAGSQLREFIWDLAAQLVIRANPPQPPSHPPWINGRRPRPRKPIRSKEELLAEVEKEAKVYLGLEEREIHENLIIRWSRKRRDHVDEILVRESGEEEWEWTDFTEEESIVKNRIAEALIEESLAEATAAIALAFKCKFAQ